MDHLPQPQDPINPHITIPYYCRSSDTYDGGNDFSAFPDRHGWDKQKLRQLELEAEQTPDAVMSILQSWLFFGVLQSVINVPFDLGSFITSDENNERRGITTRALPDLVAKWFAATKPTETEISSWTPTQKIARYHLMMQEAQRVRLIFEEANMTLVSISYAASRSSIVPQAFLLSLEILLSSLSNSAVFMYGLDHMASVGGTASIDFRSLGMFTDWCPFMFRRMSAILNTSALYFLGRIRSFQSPRLHNGCTIEKCQSERVDPDDYCIAHCCATAVCETKGLTSADINRILDNDDYPIALLSEDHQGSISIDVVPARDAPPYVAISHVWAHGLGNPLENTMPMCQLKRLWDLVKVFTAQERSALWIDTLLCPVEGRYCNLAIAKMVPTYRNAQIVLVLDEGIQQTEPSLPPIEILAHIVSSTWMQRLWTLQEGALNPRVVLQLDDGYRDFDEILSEVGDNNLVQSCHETVSRDLLNACQTLRLNGIPETPGPNLDFGLWINMLQYRKTSELAMKVYVLQLSWAMT